MQLKKKEKQEIREVEGSKVCIARVVTGYRTVKRYIKRYKLSTSNSFSNNAVHIPKITLQKDKYLRNIRLYF